MDKKGNILLIFPILAIFVGISIFYFTKKSPNPTPNLQESVSPTLQPNAGKGIDIKKFNSKTLRLTISIPKEFNIKDEAIRILLSNKEGLIVINRNGTQFDNLHEYLENFDQQTNLEISQEKRLKINELEGVVRIYKSTDTNQSGEKIYFIYKDNFLYKITTTEKSLYNTLDQIAQSFQYTP